MIRPTFPTVLTGGLWRQWPRSWKTRFQPDSNKEGGAAKPSSCCLETCKQAVSLRFLCKANRYRETAQEPACKSVIFTGLSFGTRHTFNCFLDTSTWIFLRNLLSPTHSKPNPAQLCCFPLSKPENHMNQFLSPSLCSSNLINNQALLPLGP